LLQDVRIRIVMCTKGVHSMTPKAIRSWFGSISITAERWTSFTKLCSTNEDYWHT